jgi:hypothetical protein
MWMPKTPESAAAYPPAGKVRPSDGSGPILPYPFTTLALPAGQILELHELRWNVEIDLGSP